MQLDRRSFVKASGAEPKPHLRLRSDFVIRTEIQVQKQAGVTQAWVPVPAVNDAEWLKALGSTFTSNGSAELKRDEATGAEFVHASWPESTEAPDIEVVSRISTRGRATTFDATRAAVLSDPESTLSTSGRCAEHQAHRQPDAALRHRRGAQEHCDRRDRDRRCRRHLRRHRLHVGDRRVPRRARDEPASCFKAGATQTTSRGSTRPGTLCTSSRQAVTAAGMAALEAERLLAEENLAEAAE